MSAAILVVEDEPAIQELIAVNLARNGHRVRRAASGGDAFAAIAEALPDVILLDWMLPDTAGPAIAQRLRGEARTREVPLIMLTARAGEDDKVAGLAAGADDYITKPFSPRELEARIQAVLRRRAPQLTRDAVAIEGLVITDRVHTRTQILDQVWGDHVFIEDRTVDVHIRRLRDAIAPSGHDDLVETVRGAGYRFLSRRPKSP